MSTTVLWNVVLQKQLYKVMLICAFLFLMKNITIQLFPLSNFYVVIPDMHLTLI